MIFLLHSSGTQGDCRKITGKFNCCYLTWQHFQISLSSASRRVSQILAQQTGPCVCKSNIHNWFGLPSRHLFKGYSTMISLFPFFSFPFICWFGVFQAAVCFMVYFTFPNVIFPMNTNNAPFLGSIPVALFVMKLAGEFKVAFHWLTAWPCWQLPQ